MYCWMLKYAIQHGERQLNVVEQNRAWDCSALFLSTSCRLLNDVRQSFSSLVSHGLVERSNMATGTAAVLEWNFENVLICGFWALRSEHSMPRKKSCFSSILESKFSFFPSFFRRFIITATTFAAQSDNNISSSAISKFSPKCAQVAEHELNEYSTSRNNLSTSPTLVQHLLSNKCWTVYHWL